MDCAPGQFRAASTLNTIEVLRNGLVAPDLRFEPDILRGANLPGVLIFER